MPHKSRKPTTIYTTGDWCALKCPLKTEISIDLQPDNTTWNEITEAIGSLAQDASLCLVSLLCRKTGTGIVVAPKLNPKSDCYYIIGKSAMTNFEKFQVRHYKKVVHRYSPLHKQHIGTFIVVVRCSEYAVDALCIKRFEPPPSWDMR